MFSALSRALVGMMLIATFGVAYAVGDGIQFSAEAVQKTPKGTMNARMFVGKDAVRTEYNTGQQQAIEIVYPDKRERVMLLPGQHAYMEQKGGPAPQNQSVPSADNPCAGIKDATCKQLGTEVVNGRKAQKWEMTATQNGRKVRSLLWIDAEGKYPIKEFYPDGTVMELHDVGTDTVNGRKTRKWETVITRTDGQSTRSTQWYDPELKIVIREEMPGGYVRELKNISVGPQPAELFQIPAGYQKINPPPAPSGQQQRPQGMPPQGMR
jgi:hypothetical protein